MVDGEFKLIPIDEYQTESWRVSENVLPDTIPDTWHPVTGEYCSSRTGMIKIAKAHGLEERGNEKFTKKPQFNYNRSEVIEQMKHHHEQLTHNGEYTRRQLEYRQERIRSEMKNSFGE